MLPRVALLVLTALACCTAAAPDPLAWPAQDSGTRPWSYWWWLGSAVDRANLTRELERYRDAGMGGVHIIPIYGAKGYESRCVEYLSPAWMELLRHTVSEARRLGLDVDMTTGTGWCFGGPQIGPREASARVVAKKNDAPEGPAFTISQVSTVRVKRAAPGGEGFMLNPLFADAFRVYLRRFAAAFDAYDGPKPRAMYHDSFEYGANWSPDLLAEFEKRRGYRLEDHYSELFEQSEGDAAARVKADYRETVSDVLIENSIPLWIEWCRARGIRTRYQAHGSPGNLLDLYALSDIPETEMFNRDRSSLVSKLASSAAHVAGRRLVASETGTWLKEHFTETLADLKELADQLFLTGVNHIVYHGTAYSPDEAPWPGWLFYASTEMNPRNSIWRDVPALNAYLARVQSVLQSGAPDNDLLLYWPVYDVWHDPSGLLINMTVHHRAWIESQPVHTLAQALERGGYSFDFISDRQLADAKSVGRGVRVPGGEYRAIVVPRCAPTCRRPRSRRC